MSTNGLVENPFLCAAPPILLSPFEKEPPLENLNLYQPKLASRPDRRRHVHPHDQMPRQTRAS